MDDSKLIRLEAETYRLAVEAAERRGFATISELFKAYDAALLRLSECQELGLTDWLDGEQKESR